MEKLADIRSRFMIGKRCPNCRSRRLKLVKQAEACQCAVYQCVNCGKEIRYACAPIMFEPNAWELVEEHIWRSEAER